MANENSALHQLSGDYRDGVQEVRIHADGRFTWQTIYVPSGTDAGMAVAASGKVRFNAHSITLSVDERSLTAANGGPLPVEAKALLPSRFYPVKVLDFFFLLDEKAINDIANRVNAHGLSPIDASSYLHRVQSNAGGSGAPLQVEPEALMPRDFRHRILKAPLHGKVLSDGITEKQVNVARWMQPPVWRKQYAARLVIDQGASRAVFQGMRLYVGSARQNALVQRVLADASEAQIVWIDVAPQVGDGVSSAFR